MWPPAHVKETYIISASTGTQELVHPLLAGLSVGDSGRPEAVALVLVSVERRPPKLSSIRGAHAGLATLIGPEHT